MFNSKLFFFFSLSQKFLTEKVFVCHFSGGGGGTRMSRGYQARPKIHVIMVVFQDQALYARTSFRGAKTCKIRKKSVFLVI